QNDLEAPHHRRRNSPPQQGLPIYRLFRMTAHLRDDRLKADELAAAEKQQPSDIDVQAVTIVIVTCPLPEAQQPLLRGPVVRAVHINDTMLCRLNVKVAGKQELVDEGLDLRAAGPDERAPIS